MFSMVSSKPAVFGTVLVFGLLILPYMSRDDFFFRTNYGLTTTHLKEDPSSNDLFRFPRWGEEGIRFDHLMKFVFGAFNYTASTVSSDKSRSRFPEILYVVDDQGVWVSSTLAQRSAWKQMLSHRSRPTEQLFTLAWEILQETNSPSRWKYLGELSSNGFPFLAWFGDYKSCNFQNWDGISSVPLFTTCAPLSCRYAFPIPNYQNAASAQPNAQEWARNQAVYDARYPWSSKTRKLVWRGSLSAPNGDWNSTRWRAVVKAHHAENADRVDVGFVSIGHINAGIQDDIDWNLIGGALKEAISPMQDFQKYVAILDVDGNSWSSRFGELLCYNSIVVKVQPEYVEYFYRDLYPWKHYIPMAADLSDWNEVLDFAFNPRNDETIQRIKRNANRWCSEHLTLNSLAISMLDVWESYIYHLYTGNADWDIEWAKYKTLIFNSGFDMVKL